MIGKIFTVFFILLLFSGVMLWAGHALGAEPQEVLNPVEYFQKSFDKFTEEYKEILEKNDES